MSDGNNVLNLEKEAGCDRVQAPMYTRKHQVTENTAGINGSKQRVSTPSSSACRRLTVPRQGSGVMGAVKVQLGWPTQVAVAYVMKDGESQDERVNGPGQLPRSEGGGIGMVITGLTINQLRP